MASVRPTIHCDWWTMAWSDIC